MMERKEWGEGRKTGRQKKKEGKIKGGCHWGKLDEGHTSHICTIFYNSWIYNHFQIKMKKKILHFHPTEITTIAIAAYVFGYVCL